MEGRRGVEGNKINVFRKIKMSLKLGFKDGREVMEGLSLRYGNVGKTVSAKSGFRDMFRRRL